MAEYARNLDGGLFLFLRAVSLARHQQLDNSSSSWSTFLQCNAAVYEKQEIWKRMASRCIKMWRNYVWRRPITLIPLLDDKLYGLSPSGGNHSLLFDQGFRKIRAPSDGDHTTIWLYFVLMRLYLAMLFISSIISNSVSWKSPPQDFINVL